MREPPPLLCNRQCPTPFRARTSPLRRINCLTRLALILFYGTFLLFYFCFSIFRTSAITSSRLLLARLLASARTVTKVPKGRVLGGSLGLHFYSSEARRLRTEMSSSISSQWIPIPGPMNLQFNRCWGVAFRSRGNHSKGALTRRPSTKVTSSESSVISTSIALASALVLPVASNVVIPCPLDEWFVLFNQLSDLFKLLAARAIRLRQHNRTHPEVGIVFGILNVNLDWFLRFTAEKKNRYP